MDELQLFRAITSFSMIYWKPLEVGWFIEYTDGASKGNPDPNSIAFCIRDRHGDLLVAQGNRVRDTTSMETEVMAIKACLTYCRKHSISQLILESDSWNIVQILNVKWLIPWSLAMRVKPIKTLMESMSVRVIHSHRKGNTLDDFITNWVFTCAASYYFMFSYPLLFIQLIITYAHKPMHLSRAYPCIQSTDRIPISYTMMFHIIGSDAQDCKHHMTIRVYFGVVTNLVSEPKVLKYPRASECRIKVIEAVKLKVLQIDISQTVPADSCGIACRLESVRSSAFQFQSLKYFIHIYENRSLNPK
ncbi:hypothetical protein FXO37_13850 [Capsicum annuum]|nr:hypothetical protein FXO37_13850 [Capsicum annuum]